MVKKLTQYVKTIGSQKAGNPNQGIWEFAQSLDQNRGAAATVEHASTIWCVPTGISEARFEIWGAGGQPGGAESCCGIGPPSSSGAYAYKKIGVTPGQCYNVYAGISYCATPCRCGGCAMTAGQAEACHVRYNTFVTGSGLTNFCAEHGNHSCYITCGGAATGEWEAVTGVDSDTTFLWNDSENAPQAQYYGADGGTIGINGYAFTNKQGNPKTTGEFCTWRWAVPYPGGLVTKQGGHYIAQACCNQAGCMGMYFNHTFGYGGGARAKGGAYAAGAGLPSAMSCGGTAQCGGVNNHGRVRITYT